MRLRFGQEEAINPKNGQPNSLTLVDDIERGPPAIIVGPGPANGVVLESIEQKRDPSSPLPGQMLGKTIEQIILAGNDKELVPVKNSGEALQARLRSLPKAPGDYEVSISRVSSTGGEAYVGMVGARDWTYDLSRMKGFPQFDEFNDLLGGETMAFLFP